MVSKKTNLNEMINIPHDLQQVASLENLKLYSSMKLMKKFTKSMIKNTTSFKNSKRLYQLVIEKHKIIPCYLTKGLLGYTIYKLFATASMKSTCGFFSPQTKRIYILLSNNTFLAFFSSDKQLAKLTLHECMHAYFDQTPSNFKSVFKDNIIEYYSNFIAYIFDNTNNKLTLSLAKEIAEHTLKFEESTSKSITANDVSNHVSKFIEILQHTGLVLNKEDEVIFEQMKYMMLSFMFNTPVFFASLNKFKYFFKGFYYAYHKTFGTTDTNTLPVQEFFFPSEIIAIGSEVSKNKSPFIAAFNKLKV